MSIKDIKIKKADLLNDFLTNQEENWTTFSENLKNKNESTTEEIGIELPNSDYGRVTTQNDPLNFRDENGNVIKTLPKNSYVEILENDGSEWIKVKVGDQVGYVSKDFISTDNLGNYQEVATENTSLNVRSDPTTNSNVFSSLEKGSYVETIDETAIDETGRSWTKVKLDNGQEGWVATEYLNDPLAEYKNTTTTQQATNVTSNNNDINIEKIDGVNPNETNIKQKDIETIEREKREKQLAEDANNPYATKMKEDYERGKQAKENAAAKAEQAQQQDDNNINVEKRDGVTNDEKFIKIDIETLNKKELERQQAQQPIENDNLVDMIPSSSIENITESTQTPTPTPEEPTLTYYDNKEKTTAFIEDLKDFDLPGYPLFEKGDILYYDGKEIFEAKEAYSIFMLENFLTENGLTKDDIDFSKFSIKSIEKNEETPTPTPTNTPIPTNTPTPQPQPSNKSLTDEGYPDSKNQSPINNTKAQKQEEAVNAAKLKDEIGLRKDEKNDNRKHTGESLPLKKTTTIANGNTSINLIGNIDEINDENLKNLIGNLSNNKSYTLTPNAHITYDGQDIIIDNGNGETYYNQAIIGKLASIAGRNIDLNKLKIEEDNAFIEKRNEGLQRVQNATKEFADEINNAKKSEVNETTFMTITDKNIGGSDYTITHVVLSDPSRQMLNVQSNGQYAAGGESLYSMVERTPNAVAGVTGGFFKSDNSGRQNLQGENYAVIQNGKPVETITTGIVTEDNYNKAMQSEVGILTICYDKDGNLFNVPEGTTVEQAINEYGVVGTFTSHETQRVNNGQIVHPYDSPKNWEWNKEYNRTYLCQAGPGEYYLIQGYGTPKNAVEYAVNELGCTFVGSLEQGSAVGLATSDKTYIEHSGYSTIGNALIFTN